MEQRQDVALAKAIHSLGKPEFAASLSAFLRACAEFDNLIVILYRGQDNPVVLYREYKDPVVFEAMDSHYVTANYVLDPFYEMHRAGVGSGIFRIFDVAPDRFRQTSYFKIYYEQTTLVDEVATFVQLGPGMTVTVCMGMDRSSGRMFTKGQISALQRHVSVITTLVEMNWRKLREAPQKEQVSGKPLAERLRHQLAEIRKIKLSSRQAEVALLILQGHSSGSIALILGISSNTVKVFRKQLYTKCRLSSQAELFATILPLLYSPETPETKAKPKS